MRLLEEFWYGNISHVTKIRRRNGYVTVDICSDIDIFSAVRTFDLFWQNVKE